MHFHDKLFTTLLVHCFIKIVGFASSEHCKSWKVLVHEIKQVSQLICTILYLKNNHIIISIEINLQLSMDINNLPFQYLHLCICARLYIASYIR